MPRQLHEAHYCNAAMLIFVDGNNVLFAARQFPSIGPADPEQLCRVLGRWARQRQADVTIVFDGPHPGLVLVRRMEAMGVRVRFSAKRSADDVLVDLIDRHPSPGSCTVVSSDHAVQHAARYRRATAIDADEFLRQVLPSPRSGQPRPAPAPPEKPDTVPPGETDAWLRRFERDLREPLDDTELMT